ncbi:MAG: hypothetical protein WCW44_03985 [archaeon]|jgi:rubrerythrin
MAKKFWKCTICGDMHYGEKAPEKCPTCNYPREKYIEIKKEEFIKLLN